MKFGIRIEKDKSYDIIFCRASNLKNYTNFEENIETIEINGKDENIVNSCLLINGNIKIDKETRKLIDYPKKYYDIKIEDFNKIQIIRKIINKSEDFLSKLKMINAIELMLLNNELADKGFTITDANREEKYLEILEKEDKELLDLLERYLELKDIISPLIFKSKMVHKEIEKLHILDDNSIEVLEMLKN